MSFSKALSDQIMEIVRELVEFGSIEEFRYSISDIDPADASRPDYGDSDWTSYKGKPPFRRDQGVTWVRAEYTVPDFCKDIPIAGSELRIAPYSPSESLGVYFSPIQIYADGKLLLKEDAWMDCKCPEGIITTSAEPGHRHKVAVRLDLGEKSFWEPNLPMTIISDAVEKRALHLASIIEELEYAESFECANDMLPKAYALLETAVSKGTGALMEAVQECRRLCEPLRTRIKRDKVYVVTHAHIDMNWFWPIEETRRIVDRDFTTMTTLMEENPDFKFSQSQCATYLMEEHQNPEVFAKMQRFVDKGQWDVTSSTWVEGDMNMASGEAVSRHVLYSKKYLDEKFGVEPKIMWCPDTFGHPANAPQVLKKSGIDYYFHTRCGIGATHAEQNDFDYMRDAHHVPLYWWYGQDGSRVLSCNMIYGREYSTRGVLRLAKAVRERLGYNKSMFVFGVGDHGGGPTRRDIAWMRETSEFPTMPTVIFSTTKEFYEEVLRDNPDLPEHHGEMNFVFDGCYTTHGNIKYYNRKSESALEAVESLCVMASLQGFDYPSEEFAELWKVTLFNQFHDILDGAGVKDTYLFSVEEARKALARLQEIENSALSFIAGKASVAEGRGIPVLAYNPTFIRREDCVFVPVKGDFIAQDEQGTTFPTQKTDDGTLVMAALPPMGYKVLYLIEKKDSPSCAVRENGDYYNISTNYYDIEIHKGSGRITTLYDKMAGRFAARRESIGWRLKNGCLNTLEVHYEEPTEMSAWTIGSVRGVKSLISGAKSSILEDGPVRCRIRFEHAFDSSSLRQDILIYPDSPRIDFETYADWREYGDFDRDAPMLKASFSPDIRNSSVVYEVPFGVVERFPGDYECPALRFADISGDDYGFALLNDSKYGYKCCGNRLELTLIRSGWLPDQKSDVGEHRFTYSILLHKGNYLEGGVPAQSAFLNNPVRAITMGSGGSAAPAAFLFAPECRNIPVCGVKRSEDGADIVLKLYNTTDAAVKTNVKTGFAVDCVTECNFLEKPIPGSVSFCEDSFSVVLAAREIKSFRVSPK
ncbi:MAG: glycosyl hydrolase-related protein [Oscillospiraceae bacterium]|nr:glycosyl hydrolase-related protein [Oscillospiraceae bacterium]